MELSELAVLRERYTDKGTWTIGYYDDCKYEQSACKQLLPYLQGFEAPDMIAISGKELLILEHFSFDGSKETRKGMIGHRQEKNAEQELEQYFETVKSDNTYKQCRSLQMHQHKTVAESTNYFVIIQQNLLQNTDKSKHRIK